MLGWGELLKSSKRPNTSYMASWKRDSIYRELRAPFFVLVVVVPLLALASFFVHEKIDDTARFQQSMRTVQRARALVFRIQLNEETGLRGFTSTGDASFLEPYRIALAKAPAAFDGLAKAVATVELTAAVPLVESERRSNADWLAKIARPLIAKPDRTSQALALQRLGKANIDTFRAFDQRLQATIDAAASRAADRSEAAISLVLILNVAVIGVLALAALAFGFLQARAARTAFETRMLYENEKRIADALQEAFLQKALPFTPGVGLHATYVPASAEAQVGGDWYDAFELPDKRIMFSIGDVAGHGLDAAVMMNRARQAIVSAALHENDPAVVLQRANRSLLLQDSRMVTAICGYIDPVTREITYATAGHPPPVMARVGSEPRFLDHEGLPLGIVPDPKYRSFTAIAERGAMMILYTDGVLEHKRDIVAGQARLLEAARVAVGDADPALAIRRHVFESSEPTDDVAILTISFARIPGDGAVEVPSLSALQANRWQAPPGESDTDGRPHTVPVENVDVDQLAVADVAAVRADDREAACIG